MVLNKKGTSIFFLLMIGVVFFLLGLALAPALKNVTQEAMDSSMINCSDTSISNQNHAVCTSIDLMQFIFIGALFGFAGVVLAGVAVR